MYMDDVPGDFGGDAHTIDLHQRGSRAFHSIFQCVLGPNREGSFAAAPPPPTPRTRSHGVEPWAVLTLI